MNYWRDGLFLMGGTLKAIIDNRKTPKAVEGAVKTVLDKILNPLGPVGVI